MLLPPAGADERDHLARLDGRVGAVDAFQLGAWTLAAGATSDPGERARNDRLCDRYARALRRSLTG